MKLWHEIRGFYYEDFRMMSVCLHPDAQQIMTNQQKILIRSLTLRNKKGDSCSKDVKSPGATETYYKFELFVCFIFIFSATIDSDG